MVTLHEVITFLVSMQISISSLQTHNVNRCGRSRHLARSEERFSRNAETELVCRLLLEKKKSGGPPPSSGGGRTPRGSDARRGCGSRGRPHGPSTRPRIPRRPY